MTPDVNVLLAAFRSDHPQHVVALACVQAGLSGAATGRSFTLLPMVVAGFLRLPRTLEFSANPHRRKPRVAYIDSLLAVPGVEIVELGREWPALRRFMRDHSASGNDVPDAWIAQPCKRWVNTSPRSTAASCACSQDGADAAQPPLTRAPRRRCVTGQIRGAALLPRGASWRPVRRELSVSAVVCRA